MLVRRRLRAMPDSLRYFIYCSSANWLCQAKLAKPEGVDKRRLAGLTRLELATFHVTGGRSNQLSYSPRQFSGSSDRTRTCDLTINSRVLYQLSYRGIHLPVKWWAVLDSNQRPPVCKTDALPAELTAPAISITS